MRTEFDPNVPAELLPVLTRLLNRYSWLAPSWLQLLYVSYEGSSPVGAVADISTSKPYRNAVMCIKGNFLLDGERERRATIIHELLHIPTQAAITFAKDTFKLLFDDGQAPKFEKHVLRQLDDHYEAGVQDLTYRILAFDESISGDPFQDLRPRWRETR